MKMVKYVTVAAVLKLFSSCSPMKKLYRTLGNKFGSNKRLQSGIPDYYIENVKWILDLCKKHNVIKDGDKLIELGTGWLHWEATTTRLFFEIEAILFDIWDNRQLGAFKGYFAELGERIEKEIGIDPAQNEHVQNTIRDILSVDSFDDIYDLLGFQYVVEPSGKLNNLQDESFNVIISLSVLEHIKKDILYEYVQDFYKLLKPGGYSIHTISLVDHLYLYDKSVSPKNYLKYSDTVWKYCFESEVNYINKIQKSEWLDLFKGAGFDLVEEESLYSDIGKIKIDKKYKNFDKRDLECISMQVVHRKPSS